MPLERDPAIPRYLPLVTDRPLSKVTEYLNLNLAEINPSSKVFFFGAGVFFSAELALQDLTGCQVSLVDMSLAQTFENAWVRQEGEAICGTLLDIVNSPENPNEDEYISYAELQQRRKVMLAQFATQWLDCVFPLSYRNLKKAGLINNFTHILDSFGPSLYVSNKDYEYLCENIAVMLDYYGLYAAAPLNKDKVNILCNYVAEYNELTQQGDKLILEYWAIPYENYAYTVQVRRLPKE